MPPHRRVAVPVRLRTMQTLVADHPLIAHKLTMLRDVSTESPVFRSLTDELVTLLAYEATRDIRVAHVTVQTPLAAADGVRLARPKPLVIPVLRAGIGMLDGMARLLPKADVGFVGLARDEKTLVASTYATRLPADLSGRDTFVLDPMLATGGTLETVFEMLASRGAASMTAICLLAAPEGIVRVRGLVRRRLPDPGQGGHRRARRAAERAGLHRARPRRRRRPPVRRDLTAASSRLRRPLGRAAEHRAGSGPSRRPPPAPARPGRNAAPGRRRRSPSGTASATGTAARTRSESST